VTATEMNEVRTQGQATGPTAAEGTATDRRHVRPGLAVRFVTRMSDDLHAAIVRAARSDGISTGAWMRRTAMGRLALQSDRDAHSNAPTRRPEQDVATLAAAVRELATLSAALSLGDVAGARAGVDRARRILIPLALGRSGTR